MTRNRPNDKSLQCYHSAFLMPALCALSSHKSIHNIRTMSVCQASSSLFKQMNKFMIIALFQSIDILLKWELLFNRKERVIKYQSNSFLIT